ncbi:hypothetical protein [Ornithinimicrobium cavernae]|uniref:hypothetical protein n=1 Tax=Ornithinimicrobium cavernae TaxID=2666047 RepID=UPI0012B18564|nr:hypothetical protein [Ornithinimicrobium cavernae]
MPMRETRTSTAPARFASIGAFLAARASVSGTVEIDHHGVPLHFLYDWRDAPTTLVSFAGSVPAKVKHVPAWSGDRMSQGLGVNRVLISDPTIALSTALQLAWYGGNSQQPNLQRDLTDLISAISEDTRTILFGPSGGGFAALYQAAMLPDTFALVSNPQTSVFRYTKAAVEKYMTIGWSTALNTERVPFTADVVDLYARPNSASVVYMQNTSDRHHMRRHLPRFREALHPENRVEFLLPDFGPGHIGSDRQTFIRLLETMRDHPRWDELTTAIRGLELTRNV